MSYCLLKWGSGVIECASVNEYKAGWEHCVPTPCLTTAIWRCRKNSSQWQRSFQWKLHSHWLKFLWQRHVAVVRRPRTGCFHSQSCVASPGHQRRCMQSEQTLVFHEGGFQLPAASEFRKDWKCKYISMFSKNKFSTTRVKAQPSCYISL